MFEMFADWHKCKILYTQTKVLLACSFLNITIEWLVISLTSENSKI